jgi:toxin ParE1/3/4
MQVSYLSSAITDLVSIRDYIAANQPKLAQPIGRKLRDRIQGLARFPNLGKPGRVFGTRELVIPIVGKKTYVVVYRVVDDEVQILRILAGARDIDTILKDGADEINLEG